MTFNQRELKILSAMLAKALNQNLDLPQDIRAEAVAIIKKIDRD